MARLTKEFSCWFDFPDDPDQGRVEIVHLSDKEVAEIADQASVNRWRMGDDGKLAHELTSNQLMDRRLTCRAAVRNWENFYDDDGQPMACTPEARELWAHNAKFWRFVCEKRRELAEVAVKRLADLAKN